MSPLSSRKLVFPGLAVLGLVGLWAVYLVPLAAVLNVGYGASSFRHYQPYSYVRVVSLAYAQPKQYSVDVLSCLPEGATAWLMTGQGTRVPVMGRIDSEVDDYHRWLFSVSKDDPPIALVVHFGHVEHQWSLSPNPQLKHPWWYGIAPPWAKRSLSRRTGLDAPLAYALSGRSTSRTRTTLAGTNTSATGELRPLDLDPVLH